MKTLNDFTDGNVYSSVPEEAGIDYSLEQKNILRKHFLEHKEQYFKARELREICKFKKTNTDPAVRKCITEFIELEGLPIVADHRGFKLTTNLKDLEFYRQGLQQRAYGIKKRAFAISKIMWRVRMQDD